MHAFLCAWLAKAVGITRMPDFTDTDRQMNRHTDTRDNYIPRVNYNKLTGRHYHSVCLRTLINVHHV